jgi:3-hydroxyisobutyrate dehydrogenase
MPALRRQQEDSMKIGVVGLGRMGAAIAKRLREVGYEVGVWNRSLDKARPLVAAGAKLAASPAALAREMDAVITIVTDAAAIAAVYDGPNGLLAGDVRSRLFIEMSTVRPETEIALARKAAAAGADFVECPVGGTVGPALTGKLIGMAGGEEAAYARAQPILEQLCRKVERFGPVGAGASMKLAINLPLMVYWQALGEAWVLCRHLGLDTTRLIEFMAETSGGPNVLRARGGAIAQALAGKPPERVTLDCDLLRKDLGTMIEEARALGFGLPVAEATLAVYDRASAAGWGGRDGVEMPAYWSQKGR